ncbi:MAG: hypothetical protein ACRES8_03040 [Nevskiaceae bacterium]
MRALTLIPPLIAVLGLAAGAAQAQSEDEQILQSDPPAAAQEPRAQSREDDDYDDEDLDEQVFYSGFGLSRAQTDFINLGEAVNLEAVLGFRIPTAPWFGIEIDIGQTLIPGENRPEVQPSQNCGGLLEPPCPGATGDPDDLQMQALGVSAAFKTTGRFYLTGRYGYRYINTSIEEINEKRSGNGFGFGVGYRWGRGLSGVELSYKELSDDVESIGLVFFVRSAQR